MWLHTGTRHEGRRLRIASLAAPWPRLSPSIAGYIYIYIYIYGFSIHIIITFIIIFIIIIIIIMSIVVIIIIIISNCSSSCSSCSSCSSSSSSSTIITRLGNYSAIPVSVRKTLLRRRKPLGTTSLKNTKSGAGEQLLLLCCKAKAQDK